MSRTPFVHHILAISVYFLALSACEADSNQGPESNSYEVSDFAIVASDTVVSDVRDAISGGEGRTWVLSSFEPHVTLYDSAANGLVQFGQSGPGPGELRNPWYLAPHPGGIGVYDAGARRLKVYSLTGAFIEEIETPDPGGFVLNDFRNANHGEPLRVRALDGGWVFETYTGEVAHSGGLWRGRLLFLREKGEVPDTLIQYDTLRRSPFPGGPQIFAAAPLWTVCGGEEVVVLNPLDSVVTRIDSRGRAQKSIIPLALKPLADQTIESWVDRRLELAMREENVTMNPTDRAAFRQQALEETMEMAPEYAPPTKILCDAADRYWVQGFSVETNLQGYGRDWDVFQDGAQVASVRFPARVLPLFIHGRDIVGVWRDDLDVERLVQMANPLIGRP